MSKFIFNYESTIPDTNEQNKIIAERMPKYKYSKTETESYKVINCQKIVDRNYDTSNWIYLDELIKKNNDLKIFNGLLTKTYKIVVKIGKSDTIKKEYDISQQLKDIPNFIKYLCYFSCNNKIENIINNSSICANSGDKINILLMKYYDLGSIKNYNWNHENFVSLKSLIKQIISSLFIAYVKFGFIHNDTHFGNFLIKKTLPGVPERFTLSAKHSMKTNDIITKPQNIKYEFDGIIKNDIIKEYKTYGFYAIIMDFENSLKANDTKESIYFLYKNFQQIINNIQYELNIRLNNKNDILNYIDDCIKTGNMIDINYLLQLVDKFEMIDKIDLTKLIKYNPNL
jgi:hypothetical protein